MKCLYLLLLFYLIERSSQVELIDLSYTFDDDTPNDPVLRRFKLSYVRHGISNNGHWLEMSEFCSSEHSGTHMDAPRHFSRGGKAVDEIQLEKLYRVPGVMMDFREKERGDQNYEVKISDLEDWESEHGYLPDGCVVLIRTGRGDKAMDIYAYTGMDQSGNTNHPGLGQEAAEWIVRYKDRRNLSKGILGVGVDTLSIDVGTPNRMLAHQVILENGLYGLENVAHLHLLPATGFTLTILPMKIGGGSGGPTRILAEIGGSPMIHDNASIVSSRFTSNNGNGKESSNIASFWNTLIFCLFALLRNISWIA